MHPEFVNCSSGSLFTLSWQGHGSKAEHVILHIPAFAEEMNKSRRMVALQAKAFADKGFSVLVFDLFGTGDSAGDFSDATWAIWLQNVVEVANWLKLRGARTISLWSLRSGALLAMDFITQNPGLIKSLLTWQPVFNGDLFVTQFLRLRVAAAMMNSGLPQEKTGDLKKRLQAGEALEVAGYLLNPDLMIPLMTLKSASLALNQLKSVDIFEIVANESASLSPGSMQFLEKLRGVNEAVNSYTVVGDSFWASQEIVVVPNLIKTATDAFNP